MVPFFCEIHGLAKAVDTIPLLSFVLVGSHLWRGQAHILHAFGKRVDYVGKTATRSLSKGSIA